MINPYILNIIGLAFDILGAFFIAFYVVAGGGVGLQRHLQFIMKFSDVGKNPFEEFEKYLVRIGFFFLIVGFILQAIANWVQYVSS